MSRLTGRINKAEKALNPNGAGWVDVIQSACETEEAAIARHLESHPEDKEGKSYTIIINYGDEDNFLGTYEEGLRYHLDKYVVL